MALAFIFHGIGGHPGENWFPWLKTELEAQGYSVTVPAFPNASQPQLEEWLTYFRKFERALNDQSVLVGHSLGATFILRLLERIPVRVDSCFLVAGVIRPMGNDFDPLIRSFLGSAFDWEMIRSRADHFSVFHAANDPIVPVEQGRELAEQLRADFHLIPGGGHLNEKAGCRAFPKLLEVLQKRCR